MLSYLEKFNSLPAEIRNKISSPEAMAAITDLESRYGVSLAAVIMRIMVKDISMLDLGKYFVFEHNLDGQHARELVEELEDRVFITVADYLGITTDEAQPIEADDPKLDDWMNGRKDTAAVHSSDFFFSTEDEEEVKQLAEKVQGFTGPVPSVDNAPEIAQAAVKELDYNFSSEELGSRFTQILMTYIKGIRNKLDTKQTLLKSIEEGGLGLNDVLSGKALGVADKVKEKFLEKASSASGAAQEEKKVITSGQSEEASTTEPSPEKVTPPEIPGEIKEEKKELTRSLHDSGIRDMDYDYGALEKKAVESKKTQPQDKTASKPSELQAINLRTALSEENKLMGTEKEKIHKDAVLDLTSPEEKSKESASMINVNRTMKKDSNRIFPGKVKMEDVKHVPKLSGPLDELKEMDLGHFRRLEDDASTAAKKIRDKIIFLEEEGYDKRLAGVKAWRLSPLNKLYLRIGQEAIISKKGVSGIIEEKLAENNEFLTETEFGAIMELNKSLKF